MATTLQAIYSQTVGSGGATSVTFNNIPTTYTDLKIVISGRERDAISTAQYVFMTFNGGTTNFSDTILLTNNSSTVSSTRNSYGAGNIVMDGYISSGTATANTFGIIETYIPSYTSTNFKQFMTDSVTENNSSSVLMSMQAQLWRNIGPINSISFSTYTAFAQHSTFTLYGITKG